MKIYIVTTMGKDDKCTFSAYGCERRARALYNRLKKTDRSGHLDIDKVDITRNKAGIIDAIEYCNECLPR